MSRPVGTGVRVRDRLDMILRIQDGWGLLIVILVAFLTDQFREATPYRVHVALGIAILLVILVIEFRRRRHRKLTPKP